MSYCVLGDLVDRFGTDEIIQRTDRNNTGEPDSTIVSQAIDDANAEIDSYLAGRYSLPLSSVPTNLQRLACDIARYYLYDDVVTDVVQLRYDNAINYLKMVATGKLSIGVDNTGTMQESSGLIEQSSGERLFSRE